MSSVKGIHHITAIASDPQAANDFYTRILGLRLVKKSVNQDDVRTYHLFYGDRTGEPGMDLTYFTFQPIMQGRRGIGQVTTISLAVAEAALSFWQARFAQEHVRHEKMTTSFGKPRLLFYDHDGQRLELVGLSAEELKKGARQVWTTDEVSKQNAIHFFHSAQLTTHKKALLEPLLMEVFGYEKEAQEGNLTLYALKDSSRAAYLEIEENQELDGGIPAAGTVHHIAFEVATEAEQLELREEILKAGLFPTEVIDRYYFKSVYFRTRAGILFEIATSGPGFTADESEAELGKKLALPPFLEPHRREIEAGLKPI